MAVLTPLFLWNWHLSFSWKAACSLSQRVQCSSSQWSTISFFCIAFFDIIFYMKVMDLRNFRSSLWPKFKDVLNTIYLFLANIHSLFSLCLLCHVLRNFVVMLHQELMRRIFFKLINWSGTKKLPGF